MNKRVDVSFLSVGERRERESGQDILSVGQRGREGEKSGQDERNEGKLSFPRLAGKLAQTHRLGREEGVFQGISCEVPETPSLEFSPSGPREDGWA